MLYGYARFGVWFFAAKRERRLRVKRGRFGSNASGLWRDGRVVEGGGLENRWAATPRGFESLSLRNFGSGEMTERLKVLAC